ncbi:MAG: hypothetical protein EBR02_01590 [Alphaproteobacteria bacterium]|nr:hypothetical protein [Alphaproteobacteria bacterium]
MRSTALKIDSFAQLEAVQRTVLQLVAITPLEKPSKKDERVGLEMGDFAEKYFLGASNFA